MNEEIKDMKTILTRLFTVALLMMVSMGARAEIKIDLGGKDNNGVYEGGTVTAEQSEAKDGKVTVTLTFTPYKNYSITRKDVLLAYTAPTNTSGNTRADNPTLGETFNPSGSDDVFAYPNPATYTVTVDANLGLSVQKVEFKNSRDSGAKAGGDEEPKPIGYDYSGTYYIANYNDGVYSSTDKTDNFYLCPASNYFDGDGEGKKKQPFLTTHKPDNNPEKETKPIFTETIAKWEIEFAKTGDDDVDYYYIKFLGSDNNEYYIVHNSQIVKNNKGRVRVHLQTTKDETEDNNLFFITQGTKGDKKNLNLCPKAGENVDNSGLRSSLNPAKANLNDYSGQNIPNNNPGSFKRNGIDSQTIYCGGLVGYWTTDDKTGLWYLEEVKCKTPVISYSSETGEVTIESATEGATIYYTTDGTTNPDPQNSGGNNPTKVYNSNGKPTISEVTTIKAIAVKTFMENSEVATQSIEKLENPSVSFDDATQKVIITANGQVEGATSVYTIDGNNPTPSSEEYSEPISLTGTTTVKAMTLKDGYINSDVVSLTVTKLTSSPSFSISGSTVTLSCSDQDAIIHYTTDGKTPTLESSLYSAPFSLEGSQKYTIKAIATKSGYLHSDVAEGVVDNRSTIPAPTITYTGSTVTITAVDAGDEIYYTTDGSTPTTSTLTHFTSSGSFNLANGSNYTVKAIASNGIINSTEATETIDLTDVGYSGIYYIRNNANNGDFYMYPVGGESALVKTAKKTDEDAIWKIEIVGDYYRIIHYKDGKYLVAKDVVDGSMPDEETVSLVETDSPGENTLFEITRKSGEESDIMQQILLIRPKAAPIESEHKYLNTRGGNDGTHTIGLYDDTGSSEWKLATVPAKPTFTVNDIKVTISSALGNVYYTIDGTTPTSSSSSGKNVTLAYGPNYTVKAISIYHDDISNEDWTSEVATSNLIRVNLLNPIISRSSDNVTITNSQASGVTFRFTFSDNGTDPENPVPGGAGTDYTTAISLTANARNVIKAIAYNIVDASTYTSDVVTFVVDLRGAVTISSLAEITSATGSYKLSSGFSATGTPEESGVEIGTSTNPFKGTIDGNLVEFELSSPLFDYVEDATIKNVIISKATISTSGNAGAIANNALGATRIYNCGVLATNSTVEIDDDGYTNITSCSSTISGGGYVGGIVGLLDGSSRVINCFSYANITGGNKVGGIVGWNNVATTSVNQATMVMNCMFYGDITGGNSKAPIYNGKIITNRSDQNGMSNFNYFWAGASYVQGQNIDIYNCALSAETRFLQRFEFFRPLLNSNRALAAWWATGSRGNKDDMMKWVLEPSQIGTSIPYPILKAFDKYPSVVNIDADHAEVFSSSEEIKKTEYNQGRKFGTLTINIQNATSGAPTGANITTTTVYPNITDKDPVHFNFNYYKVQLPYYNDVGTKNYTDNKVVTGWKIVTISGGTHSFSDSSSDATATVNENGDITLTTPYNFADRKSTDKDNFDVSGRVFSQGAYFDVPEGVSSITIEPYWGKCVYVSDQYPDVVYNQGMTASASVTNVGGGQLYANNTAYIINGSSQKVYTKFGGNDGAVNALNPSGTVYDNAIVLVGNFHSLDLSNKDKNKPYTIMSIDMDKDNEPDYSYILRFNGRLRVHPVRVDFLNVIGLGMAQKSSGGTGTYNFGIMQPYGWFECTNTGLFRVTQFEYDYGGKNKVVGGVGDDSRVDSPMILQGGVIEQWVTVGGREQEIKASNSVTYYHVGGNVWFKEFHIGVHQDKTQNEFVSPHPPISVTGGDFDELYLTGLYNTPNANYPDNAECYINGGHFGKVAGTGMQGLGKSGGEEDTGNIIWQIDNADIDEFYAGGINATHVAEGNIMTVISNSRVDQFCGGPKFGDMNNGKVVVTNATNCTFRTFFGAGYGGNSYNRRYPTNQESKINIEWNTWLRGSASYDYSYDSNYGGVETRIDYQFLPMSNNNNNVCRLFIDYVSFSLATTRNVTSKLTDCTITTSTLGSLKLFDGCIGNFYGGGSLGKVDGPVKSTLTNCIVEGNVYGAGYSATLPPVDVMNQSFEKEPFYDQNLGAFLEAVKPLTTPYTWEHAETVNSTETAINTGTPKTLFTTENLDKSNLGSVNGAVTLTIEGDSKIGTDGDQTGNTGNVFGGGDESYVVGSANKVTVTLKGNANVLGNVFGGGDEGLVEGSTEVNIQ